MRTLSIRQPWASLICAGIKDVENRSRKTLHRGKLLIHSSSFNCPKDIANRLYLEMSDEMFNNALFGNINLNDFPSSTIIGYVDLTDCVEGPHESLWSADDQFKYVLENAYIFDEPIRDVKGKLNMFEYDLDENNLPPAHKAEPRHPRLEGTELIFPIKDGGIEWAKETEGEKNITLYATNEVIDIFCNVTEEGTELKNRDSFKTIRIWEKDGREKSFKITALDFDTFKDDDGNEVTFPSIFSESEDDWKPSYLFRVFFE